MSLHRQIMKLIPVFLIIFLFSTALVLAYIAWTTILTNSTEKFNTNNNRNSKSSNYESKSHTEEPSSKNSNSNFGILQNLIPFLRHPSLPNSENGISGLTTVDEKMLLGEDLLKNVDRIKMKVISNLRRYLLNGAKVTGHVNQYGIDFTRFKHKPLKKPNVHEMMCRIKNLNIDILDKNTSPVFQNKPFPNKNTFFEEFTINAIEKSHTIHQTTKIKPSSTFFAASSSSVTSSSSSNSKRNLDEPIYRSCAVVPNSAALDGSEHGIDIDSHEFILRFNRAPTDGYEQDVGALTSMRILNSQVVTKPEFLFPHSSYFDELMKFTSIKTKPKSQNNTTIVQSLIPKDKKDIEALNSIWLNTKRFLMWDPCNYTSTVEQWYSSPEFPIFEKYFNLTSRQNNPFYGHDRFYILNCRTIWKMWDLLREYSFAKIYGTPPTSGFIGIILSLQMCERVDIYEYVPSIRESVRCNYYGPKNDSNPSCTYGSWHPVSAEKLFALELTDSSDKQVFMDGVLSIPGVSTYKCNNNNN